MSALDDRIREAFDAVTLPDDVRTATLAAIERERSARQEAPAAHEQPEAAHRAPQVVHATQPRKRGRRGLRIALAAAACLVVAAFGIGGWTAYATETAQVSIEVNPSIELGINRFDTVVAARALNDDGAQVLEGCSVVGMAYADALDILAGEVVEFGIDESDVVAISVVCDNDDQAAALVEESDTALAQTSLAGSCHRATQEDCEQAASVGMGVGRYAAARELASVDPTVSIDDCHDMSMREIVERILAVDPDNAYAESCGWAHGGHGAGAGGGQGSGAGQGAGTGSAASSGAGSGQGAGTGHGGGHGRHHGWE